jgi:hypothetical protein
VALANELHKVRRCRLTGAINLGFLGRPRLLLARDLLMLLYVGFFFFAGGVLGELLSGTMFRSFFNWRDYPPRTSGLRIKTILGRVGLVAGLVMIIARLVELAA